MLQKVFIQVLTLSLSATLIALLVIGLRLLLKKAPKGWVCALWALVAIRLLIPSLLQSSVSVVPQTVSEGTVVREISARPIENTVKVREYDPEYTNIVARQPQLPVQRELVRVEKNEAKEGKNAAENGQNVVVGEEDAAAPEVREVKYVEVSAATLEAPKTFGNTVLPVLSYIWLTGVCGMLLYMAFSYFRIGRKVQVSVRESGNVWLSDNLSSPFILGMIRPRIYLPSALGEEEKSYVLAHEQAHLKRLDHIWKPLGFLLLSVYWFNPVMWAAYILLCRDIELACDERVIGREGDGFKKAYSEALLACSAPQKLVTACPLAFGEVGVRTRIKSVLNYKKPAFWILAGALAVSLVAAGCALTNPKGSETDPSAAVSAETTLAETTPAETSPEAVRPTETSPAASEPAGTEAAITEPAATVPIESTPSATEPTETKPHEVALKSQQSFSGGDFAGFFWNRGGFQKTSTVPLKSAGTLPDILGTAKGKTEDIKNGNSYYIATLDLTIDLPEGYYLYRVDGLYHDQEGNPLRMEFVDEYILALRNLPEEELVKEIDDYWDKNEMKHDTSPSWILWNFKIVHKVYFPVEQLYESQIEMTQEIRQAGDYLVLSGTCPWWLKAAWIEDGVYYTDNFRVAWLSPEYETLYQEYMPRGYGAENPGEEAFETALRTRYDWPLKIYDDEWYENAFMETVLNACSGCGVSHYYYWRADGDHSNTSIPFYGNGRMTLYWSAYTDATIGSEAWWNDFSYAYRELQEHAEKYELPGITISLSYHDYSGYSPGEQNAEWQAFQKEVSWQRSGWYQDASQEITARAFVYAWLKAMGQETALEDVIIYLKQSENDALLFLAFTMDRKNGCELTPVYKGIDYLSLCDMSFAREYVETYVK